MYLVCDGGGTKTEYLLFDRFGQIHGRSKSAGTNVLFIDPTSAAEAVCFGVEDCLNQAGITAEKLMGMVLFIPGFGKALDAVKERYPSVNIQLLGDECNAYYGALGQPGGIAVLAGTGSFAVGKTRAGQWVKAGGWGPLFDDKGSGYHIGIMCLERFTWLYDRGIYDTELQKLTLKHLELTDVSSIRKVAYQPDFTRARIASLSYVVAEAAQNGDKDADEILDQAATALVNLASAVVRYYDHDSIAVSLIGGLTGMGALLTEKFQRVLEKQLPQCRYYKPVLNPIIGAAIYVMYEFEHVTSLPLMFMENLKYGMEE